MNTKKALFALVGSYAIVLSACSSPEEATKNESVSATRESLTVYTSGSTNNCSSLTVGNVLGTSSDTASSNSIYGFVKAASAELPNWPDTSSEYHAACANAVNNATTNLNSMHTNFDAYHLDTPGASGSMALSLATLVNDLTYACPTYAAIDAIGHPSNASHQQNTAAYVRRAAEQDSTQFGATNGARGPARQAGPTLGYFPIQTLLKMRSRMSSV